MQPTFPRYGRALFNSFREDWKKNLWPLPSFLLGFYPEFRTYFGKYVNMELPEIPRLVLIIIPILLVLIIAFWHYVVVLEDRIEPKLDLIFNVNNQDCFNFQDFGVAPLGNAICVRVLPTSKIAINNCRGQLARICRLEKGNWVDTNYSSAMDLIWQHHKEDRTLTIHPGVNQFLDVFYIHEHGSDLFPATRTHPTHPMPRPVLAKDAIFRIDVSVIGENTEPRTICLKVTITDQWDKPKVVVIPSGSY